MRAVRVLEDAGQQAAGGLPELLRRVQVRHRDAVRQGPGVEGVVAEDGRAERVGRPVDLVLARVAAVGGGRDPGGAGHLGVVREHAGHLVHPGDPLGVAVVAGRRVVAVPLGEVLPGAGPARRPRPARRAPRRAVLVGDEADDQQQREQQAEHRQDHTRNGHAPATVPAPVDLHQGDDAEHQPDRPDAGQAGDQGADGEAVGRPGLLRRVRVRAVVAGRRSRRDGAPAGLPRRLRGHGHPPGGPGRRACGRVRVRARRRLGGGLRGARRGPGVELLGSGRRDVGGLRRIRGPWGVRGHRCFRGRRDTVRRDAGLGLRHVR